MPTVFNRVYAVHKEKNVPMLSIDHRAIVGKLIHAKFKSSGGRRAKKVDANPHDFKGQVVYYPADFRDTMDGIIIQYHKDNDIKPTYIKKKRTS